MVGYYDISEAVETISRTKTGEPTSGPSLAQHLRRIREKMKLNWSGVRYASVARRERVAVMPDLFQI